MAQEKLYRCCNTCKYKVDKAVNFYGCTKADKCYNGFSTYEPNEAMAEQERREEIDSHCPYGGDCDYLKIRKSAGSCTACPVGAAYSVPVDF